MSYLFFPSSYILVNKLAPHCPQIVVSLQELLHYDDYYGYI